MQTLVQCPQEEVIEILNYPDATLQARDRLVSRFIERKGKLPRKDWRHLHKSEVARWFRSYVEEWLKTGLNPDGSESPCRKNLYQTFQARFAVLGSLEEHPPHVAFAVDSGDLQIFVNRVRLEPQTEPHLFFQERVKDAAQLFVAVLASEWKNSLCKCRYERCGRYFIHAKPRGLYRHGTFCSREHQALASAAGCTRERRLAAGCKLIEKAARLLLEWGIDRPGWEEDGRSKSRLASTLTRYMEHDPNFRVSRQDVKVNWVTRHRAEIEQKRVALNSKRSTALIPSPAIQGPV